MFKFLKDKLKSALAKITKKVEEEAPEEVIEQVVEQPVEEIKEVPKPKKEKPAKKPKKEPQPKKEKKEKTSVEKIKEEVNIDEPVAEPQPEEQPAEKKGFFSRFFKKKEEVAEEITVKEKQEEIEKPEAVPVPEEVVEEKKGFFGKLKEKIVTKKITSEKFEELFWELEVILLENNVAVAVIDRIKTELKQRLVDKPLQRGQILQIIQRSLKESIEKVLAVPTIDVIKTIKEKQEKPYVVVFVGVNGSGKTTTIAKFANLCLENKLSVVLGAGDSFRKGAIEQLEEWGRRLGVKVIKQQYDSDSAAICWDTVNFAKRNELDVVLLDTAGRQHSNINLMREMEKIVRVVKPDLKIFIGESITGNDVLTQADEFNKTIGIDGIILTKADVDDKGGAMISVSYVTGKPILYLGVGQNLEDLEVFDPAKVLKTLGL
ncbi:signal recognition particle-docking protein FtsY [Candidatus Woesearchaeota archaeon]|nr:signal recognition particle-docking protein FtsY [Candidatus Woesearchaeota archaeon]